MAISFSSQIQNLNKKTNQLDNTINTIIPQLQGKKLSVVDAESIHNKIFETFQQVNIELSQLGTQIEKQTTYSNQEEMFQYKKSIIDIETSISKKLKTFNETVLTYCPTAKIFLDEPCIHDKTAPKINTSNAKILQMLEKCSYIREVRGDGNCFLSAFTTRFLENLVKKNNSEQFIQLLTEDGLEASELKTELVTTLFSITDPSQLETILKNNHAIWPFISYFRQLAALEMKKDPDRYSPSFLAEVEYTYGGTTQGQSYESLVDKYVLTMGVDFSQPAMIALCEKLDFPILIIDPIIGSPEGVNILDKSYADATFCRNEEERHYFVLYPREEAPLALPMIQQAPSIIIQNPPRIQTRPTEIIVRCKVPDGHHLYIRGDGNGLNWEKGIQLTQIDDDTWAYLSSAELKDMKYKFLIDDEGWQEGGDNKISQGKIEGTNQPHFTPTAQIRVRCDAGKGEVFIRGNGPGMSWDDGKGIMLHRVDNNTLIFTTYAPFKKFEYKLLLRDEKWENGHNHSIEFGKKAEHIPQFN